MNRLYSAAGLAVDVRDETEDLLPWKEVGFEMIIYTFGSGLNAESTDPAYLAKIKEDVDYARAKGIEVGAYSLFSSRRIDDATRAADDSERVAERARAREADLADQLAQSLHTAERLSSEITQMQSTIAALSAELADQQRQDQLGIRQAVHQRSPSGA